MAQLTISSCFTNPQQAKKYLNDAMTAKTNYLVEAWRGSCGPCPRSNVNHEVEIKWRSQHEISDDFLKYCLRMIQEHGGIVRHYEVDEQ